MISHVQGKTTTTITRIRTHNATKQPIWKSNATATQNRWKPCKEMHIQRACERGVVPSQQQGHVCNKQPLEKTSIARPAHRGTDCQKAYEQHQTTCGIHPKPLRTANGAYYMRRSVLSRRTRNRRMGKTLHRSSPIAALVLRFLRKSLGVLGL